jgi:hypothetical protein
MKNTFPLLIFLLLGLRAFGQTEASRPDRLCPYPTGFFKNTLSKAAVARNGKMKSVLYRPFHSGDTLYFCLGLLNRSSMAYDLDFIRFFMQDRKTVKRTLSQEVELPPLTGPSALSQVPAHQKRHLHFAFGKFPLSSGKRLVVEVFEKRGGRHLLLRSSARSLRNLMPLAQ